jgi:UDP-glucose 4-epimerase
MNSLKQGDVKMRILLTGGFGFIGQRLVSQLLREGHQVSVLDDLSGGATILPELRGSVEFYRGCVTDPQIMKCALSGRDLVFHLASVVGQARVARDPAYAVKVSRESMKLLLLLASDRPVVNFSSSAVYGRADRGPCRENVEIEAELPLAYDCGVPGYAFGKWEAERMAQPGVACVLHIRPFNVVGPGQAGCYGMVVPRFVSAALAGQSLKIYGDGRQTRCFSHVDVFVDAVLRLTRMWLSGTLAGSTFNVGSPVSSSILELAKTTGRVLDRPIRVEFTPFEEVYPGKTDVLQRVPDTTFLNEALGPIAWPSLDLILEDVARSLQHDEPVTRSSQQLAVCR